MTIANYLTIGLFVLGTILIPSVVGIVVLWADVRALKEDRADWEKACEATANHAMRLALLESAVGRLEQIPDKLDRLFELLRSKA